MRKKKLKIYLGDFVHNYFGVGTYMFPLNIGYIAAWANKLYAEDIDIELFKYPGDLMERFREEAADLVGLSNYTWNADLNNRVTGWIKGRSPQTVTVLGGPNITYTPEGYNKFFDTHGTTDFYVPYQGEIPFGNLLGRVLEKGQDLAALKSEPIDGILFRDAAGTIVVGKAVPRIKEVDEIPSPYLTGLFDKFFETNLTPITETNRGCPYQCTYCCQGLSSHNQIEYFSLERVKAEIGYISERVKNTNILFFADSNFGIANRDIEIAEYLAEQVKTHDYPRKLNVNWAKNQPKLFEIAKILNNINLIISVQSLDEVVLKNIKRSNIKLSVFKDIVDKVNQAGGMSGTEIILALPGETKPSHLKSLETLFDWNVSYIICYNCLILEGSELAMARDAGEYRCETKFRLIDNSFGKYGEVLSFETEEGVRSTSTMSEEEILYFRPVHWLIQFLWNYRFYYDLLKYLQQQEINPIRYIIALIDNVESKGNEEVRRLFQEFRVDAEAEWFDSPEALREYYTRPENFESLSQGSYGKMNGKYIFKTLLEARDSFEAYLLQTAIDIYPAGEPVIREIVQLLSASIIDFRKDGDEVFEDKELSANYNIMDWRASGYTQPIKALAPAGGGTVKLGIPAAQKHSLEILLNQYRHPNKNVTLRKMTEFMDIRDFFRKAE